MKYYLWNVVQIQDYPHQYFLFYCFFKVTDRECKIIYRFDKLEKLIDQTEQLNISSEY
jgi:hypothetical protein